MLLLSSGIALATVVSMLSPEAMVNEYWPSFLVQGIVLNMERQTSRQNLTCHKPSLPKTALRGHRVENG